MLYVVANIDKAEAAGFQMIGRQEKQGMVILNEKEVLINKHYEDMTLQEAANKLIGFVATIDEVKTLLSEGGWHILLNINK